MSARDAHQVFIIAEAGVNHNGDLDIARELIDAAAHAGADAVKFQTFTAADLVRANTPKADYQQQTTGKDESQFDMIRRLELDREAHQHLIDHCRKRDILFLSSPFDLDSIDLLAQLGLPLFKIPSGEITNLPYLRKIGSLDKEVLLSTGMSDLEEIGAAIHTLRAAGLRKQITLLHCNTEYPTPMADANLRAISTLAQTFLLPVGYSDHTLGIEACIAAAALGATVLEKHFTLDRTMAGPDHAASLDPESLGHLVAAVRNISLALGTGVKIASPSEQKNKPNARKSIVAARHIRQGERFSDANLTTKRPAWGLSPMLWDSLVGTIADRDYAKDDFIALPDASTGAERRQPTSVRHSRGATPE